MIKTSIVVPVYNTSDYLKDCFESIFKQTQKEIEVIVINDGSTDDSLYILEQIKKKYPQMIIYNQDNMGLGSSRNKGIELATGEFIYFIDSDDCLVDTALETCYRYAKGNNLDVVMFDAETFGNIRYEKGQYDRSEIITEQKMILSGEEFAIKYWMESFVPSACLIYTSAQFLKQNDLKFSPKIYYEDNEFYCRMLPLAGRVMYIPEPLYRRRYRELSITTVPFDLRHAKDMLEMIQVVNRNQFSSQLIPVIHRLQLNFLRTLYTKCMKEDLLKDTQFFQELYSTALKLCKETIENITLFPDIDLLSQIANEAPSEIVSEAVKEKLEHRKIEVARKIFSKIPMGSEDRIIGIYGTGKNTERFLYTYQEFVGTIKATLIFIDSNVMPGEKKYRGFRVYNVNELRDIPLECIIIASSKYESKIYETIKEDYGDRFRVVRLRSDLQF